MMFCLTFQVVSLGSWCRYSGPDRVVDELIWRMPCCLESSGQSFGGQKGKTKSKTAKYPEFRDESKPWLGLRKSNQRD